MAETVRSRGLLSFDGKEIPVRCEISQPRMTNVQKARVGGMLSGEPNAVKEAAAFGEATLQMGDLLLPVSLENCGAGLASFTVATKA